MKPSKFLLNPVRTLNFFWWEELERGGVGGLVSFFTILLFLFV